MSQEKLILVVNVQANRETGSISAVYMQIRPGRASEVIELADGNAFANYDIDGRLLGIELLAPCEVSVLNKLTKKEPRQVRTFFRQGIPRKMVLA